MALGTSCAAVWSGMCPLMVPLCRLVLRPHEQASHWQMCCLGTSLSTQYSLVYGLQRICRRAKEERDVYGAAWTKKGAEKEDGTRWTTAGWLRKE